MHPWIRGDHIPCEFFEDCCCTTGDPNIILRIPTSIFAAGHAIAIPQCAGTLVLHSFPADAECDATNQAVILMTG